MVRTRQCMQVSAESPTASASQRRVSYGARTIRPGVLYREFEADSIPCLSPTTLLSNKNRDSSPSAWSAKSLTGLRQRCQFINCVYLYKSSLADEQRLNCSRGISSLNNQYVVGDAMGGSLSPSNTHHLPGIDAAFLVQSKTIYSMR